MPKGSSKIPVIDIGPLFDKDVRAQARVAAALGEAARSAGVLYITGHRIPTVLFENLLAATKRFFAQTIEEKMAVYIGNSATIAGMSRRAKRFLPRAPRTRRRPTTFRATSRPMTRTIAPGIRCLGPISGPTFADSRRLSAATTPRPFQSAAS